MFNHEPNSYVCPFCKHLSGFNDEFANQEDIVYRTDTVMAKIAPKWWINNPGHVLVVPTEHYENIYDIPDSILTDVYLTVKKIAKAIKVTYNCDGVSTRQHNEPAGNQDVWHLHVHVYPRYTNDNLYQNHDIKSFVSADARLPYAQKLREFLQVL